MTIMAPSTREWREKELSFNFSKAESVRKLDGPEHGLSRCMKSVDFVVEWPDEYWMIEVKDPENSQIPTRHRTRVTNKFMEELDSGALMDEHLFPKFRDSLIYLGMDQGIPAKPMRYFALIALSSLEPAHLMTLAEMFERKEPWVMGPSRGWAKGFAFIAFTCDAWNRTFPHCPVTRIPTHP